jgi:hypothetical protein
MLMGWTTGAYACGRQGMQGGRTESPWNSGRWLSISAKMQPTDHTSTGVEYILAPSRISGARYHRVTTWPMENHVSEEKLLDNENA